MKYCRWVKSVRCLVQIACLIHLVTGDEVFAQATKPKPRVGPVVVTNLYLWFPTPHNATLNSPADWVYDPPAANSGTNQQEFWNQTVSDLSNSGFTGALLTTWGTLDTQWSNSATQVALASSAIRKLRSNLKLGLFFDPSGTEHLDPRTGEMTQSDFSGVFEKVLRPYFTAISNRYWLTHNGLAISKGGRPIIYFWNPLNSASRITNLLQAKSQFSHTFGVAPFFVFTGADLPSEGLVDAIIPWNSTYGGIVRTNVNGYVVNAVGVGNNEQLIRPWRCHGDNPLHPGSNPTDPVNNYRSRIVGLDSAGWLEQQMGGFDPNANLIFLQDSNERNEGTGILRATNYPVADNPVSNYCAPNWKLSKPVSTVAEDYARADDGRYLPESYYLQRFYSLISSYLRDIPPSDSSARRDRYAPEGGVVQSSCGEIVAWASDKDFKRGTVDIEVTDELDNNSLVAVAQANRKHSAIKKSGRNHGAVIKLPFVSDYRSHRLKLTAINIDSKGYASQQQASKVIGSVAFNCAGPADNQNVDGHLDIATCSGFAGWGRDADSTGTAVRILVKEGERTLAVFVANQPRQDLAQYIQDINHGFSGSADFLHDGKQHLLKVFAQNINVDGKASIARVNKMIGEVTLLCAP